MSRPTIAPMPASRIERVVSYRAPRTRCASVLISFFLRRVAQEIDLARADILVRGRPPREASRVLLGNFRLARAPLIQLSPPWWPVMPLVPFRVTATAGQ